MTTLYRRSQAQPHRFRIIAGRPVSPAVFDTKPTIADARRILRAEREGVRNPWFDAESDERLLAAAFADRVVLVACLIIGALLLVEIAAPDLLAWIAGEPAVMVAR